MYYPQETITAAKFYAEPLINANKREFILSYSRRLAFIRGLIVLVAALVARGSFQTNTGYF